MKLYILPLLVLSTLATNSFAKNVQLNVEVTTKNSIEKSCSLQLFEDSLVIEQEISNERGSDETVLQLTYKHAPAEIRISSDNWVESNFQKSRKLFLSNNPDVSLEKVLASEGIVSIFEDLLNGTGFARGQSGSFHINADTIANAFRAKCK